MTEPVEPVLERQRCNRCGGPVATRKNPVEPTFVCANGHEWRPTWAPPMPPEGWRVVDRQKSKGHDGARYIRFDRKMVVICSGGLQADEKLWVHLSASHVDHVPRYGELKRVKEQFLGDVHAYQAFVPVDEHVNIHPRTLHLWHCLDGPVLPDFRQDFLGMKVI